MILFEIYERFKGHFLNELCISFNLQVYNKIAEVWKTYKELFLS